MSKLLTIVTVCKDSPSELAQTVRSINSQQLFFLQRIHIFFVLGSDIPQLLQVCHSVTAKHTIQYDQNNGVFNAMNQPLPDITTPYILYLNAGDELSNISSASFLDLISTLESYIYPIIACDVIYRNLLKTSSILETIVYSDPAVKLPHATLPHPGILWSTELVRRFNGYNSRFMFTADRDLLLRIFKAAVPIHHLPLVLSIYNSTPNSLSASLTAVIEDISLSFHHGYFPSFATWMDLFKKSVKALLRLVYRKLA